MTQLGNMKNLKITLVEIASTEDGLLEGPISKDIYSHLSLPSRAIDLLAELAKRYNYNDTVSINTKYNNPRGYFTREQWDRFESSDIVAISAITRTAPQSYELARRVKQINPSAWVLIGGPHVSALPEEGLQHADIVIHKEGDHTFVDILDRIHENKFSPELKSIDGISFTNTNGEMITTKARPFLSSEELCKLPFPVYPQEVLKKLTHTGSGGKCLSMSSLRRQGSRTY